MSEPPRTQPDPHSKNEPKPSPTDLVASAIAVLKDRRYRFFDRPELRPLFRAFFQNPKSEPLQNMVRRAIYEQYAKAIASPAPEWHGNFPERGRIPQNEKGWVKVAQLPVGDPWLTISPHLLTRNTLVCGSTGSGKTTWLRHLVAGLLQCEEG